MQRENQVRHIVSSIPYAAQHRVLSDSLSLLRWSPNLVPKTESTREPSGALTPKLVLTGTIPTQFRGATYHTPITIIMNLNYPSFPPTVRVDIHPGMSIQHGHRNVDPQGIVFMDYLHNWRKETSNLVELVGFMSSLFSAAPPLYASKSGGASRSTQPKPSTTSYPYGEGTTVSGSVGGHSSSQGAGGPPPYPTGDRRGSSFMPPSPYPGPAPVKAADPSVGSRVGPGTLHRQDSDQRAVQLRTKLTSLLQQECQAMLVQTRNSIDKYDAYATKLKSGEAYLIKAENDLQTKLDSMQRSLAELEAYRADLQANLADAERHAAEEGSASANELIMPENRLSKQLIEAVAESAAYEDALYHLETALCNQTVPLDDFLREVRRTARKQFEAKALALKIAHAQRQSC